MGGLGEMGPFSCRNRCLCQLILQAPLVGKRFVQNTLLGFFRFRLSQRLQMDPFLARDVGIGANFFLALKYFLKYVAKKKYWQMEGQK